MIILCESHIDNITKLFSFRNMIMSWVNQNYLNRYDEVKLFVNMSYEDKLKNIVSR